MNKRWIIAIIAFLLVFLWAGAALALEPFPLKEYVTDQAGVLSESVREGIASELSRYDQATGNQLLVVTVPSLENREAVEFTEGLFNLNKPGQKGKDNGIILFIAKAEHKIRIEVGYGLEGVVPDGKAGTIIRDEISPRFKANDFDGGISAGVIALIKAITPDYQFGGTVPTPRRQQDRSFPAALVVAILIFGLVSVFGNRGRQDTHRRFRRGYSEPWYWGGGGGGGWSGGSSGGDSGGFSGGGGSFGGGGASGDW